MLTTPNHAVSYGYNQLGMGNGMTRVTAIYRHFIGEATVVDTVTGEGWTMLIIQPDIGGPELGIMSDLVIEV